MVLQAPPPCHSCSSLSPALRSSLFVPDRQTAGSRGYNGICSRLTHGIKQRKLERGAESSLREKYFHTGSSALLNVTGVGERGVGGAEQKSNLH